MKKVLITIDGPAGAGKTTVSRMLARRLQYTYIDTGALYRGVALAVRNAGIAPDDDAALERLCARLELKFVRDDGELRLLSNGQDITDEIRSPEITMLASAVSARPLVRNYLLQIQKDMGRDKGAVFEGRDMGTVVFPEAEVKFFLDADEETRAYRRFLELKTQTSLTLEEVQRDLHRRDIDDSRRAVAPLKPAEDAIIVQSTHQSIEEVVETMLSHIRRVTAG
jgi:cytidylate kinase